MTNHSDDTGGTGGTGGTGETGGTGGTGETGRPGSTVPPSSTGRSADTTPRRDLLAFDRYDRWGLVFLLGAVAVVAVLAWVVEPVSEWLTGAPLTPEMASAVTVPQLDAAGITHGPGTYTVDVVDPDAGQRMLALAPGVLAALLVLLACWCIVLVLRTVAAGDPFDSVNVTRLRVVAAVLVLGAPVVIVLQSLIPPVLLDDLVPSGLELTFSLQIPWVPMLAGMVVAMLAEAFKAGSRLRDDVDGLV